MHKLRAIANGRNLNMAKSTFANTYNMKSEDLQGKRLTAQPKQIADASQNPPFFFTFFSSPFFFAFLFNFIIFFFNFFSFTFFSYLFLHFLDKHGMSKCQRVRGPGHHTCSRTYGSGSHHGYKSMMLGQASIV